jgi:hypothetical protein
MFALRLQQTRQCTFAPRNNTKERREANTRPRCNNITCNDDEQSLSSYKTKLIVLQYYGMYKTSLTSSKDTNYKPCLGTSCKTHDHVHTRTHKYSILLYHQLMSQNRVTTQLFSCMNVLIADHHNSYTFVSVISVRAYAVSCAAPVVVAVVLECTPCRV